MAHQRLGKWTEAAADAQAAVQRAPGWEKAWYRLGTALAALQRPACAQLAFEQGLRLKPGNTQLQQQLERLRAEGKENKPGGAEAVAREAEFRRWVTSVTGATASCSSRGSRGSAAAAPAPAAAGADGQEVASQPPPPLTPAAAAPASGAEAAAAPAEIALAAEPPSARDLAEAEKALGNERYKEGRYEEAVRPTLRSSSSFLAAAGMRASPLQPCCNSLRQLRSQLWCCDGQ